ncbi:MAG: hypothetical protein U0W24_22520 [Bacteroidales bacterium]
MKILGNIFLLLTLILFVSIVNALYRKNIPTGGDAVMGYVWGIIFIHFALFITLSVSTLAIAATGGFHWISEKWAVRYLSAFGVLIIAILASAFGSLFKNENGPVLALLKSLSGVTPLIILPLLMILAFLMLNQGWMVKPQFGLLKVLASMVAVYSGFILVLTFSSFALQSARNSLAVAQREAESYNENIARMLTEIDSCDISKNMVFLFVFTDANQQQVVRERALKKIKSNPGWQEEMVQRLETDWAPEVFNFLASNEVEKKEMFYKPLHNGILIQARLIRENIRRCSHPSHFYPDQFNWEIDRVIRTVDRFKTSDNSYYKEVLEVRKSLDEPSEYKKVKFNCLSTLDRWLNDNK